MWRRRKVKKRKRLRRKIANQVGKQSRWTAADQPATFCNSYFFLSAAEDKSDEDEAAAEDGEDGEKEANSDEVRRFGR